MNKKYILIIIFAALIFSAGFIAVTQEFDYFIEKPEENGNTEDYEGIPPYRGYIYEREIPGWVQPIRWFKSNIGGLAIEEVPSRITALRQEYALSVYYTQKDELPDELISFYNDDFIIEVRTLYENQNNIRTLWIFRDISGNIKLISVFPELLTPFTVKQEGDTGFIEVYDENGLLSLEYNLFKDGSITRTEFNYNEGFLIRSEVFVLVNGGRASDYIAYYDDYYFYNRSMFLRSAERRFHRGGQASFSAEPVRMTFPSSIKKAVDDIYFVSAKDNNLPEYFEAYSFGVDYKMLYDTDERNRILRQTLYNEKGDIVWVVVNKWQDDRIMSTVKTEGSSVLLTEFEYDSSGNRTIERNFNNGVLERTVRTEGNIEVEDLYLDNKIILRAVWEDGVKISETRNINN